MSAPCPSFRFVVQGNALDTGPAADAFLEAFNAFLATRGLYTTDVGSSRLIVASEASQATEADRQAVAAWLGRRPGYTDWRVGDLDDFG